MVRWWQSTGGPLFESFERVTIQAARFFKLVHALDLLLRLLLVVVIVAGDASRNHGLFLFRLLVFSEKVGAPVRRLARRVTFQARLGDVARVFPFLLAQEVVILVAEWLLLRINDLPREPMHGEFRAGSFLFELWRVTPA